MRGEEDNIKKNLNEIRFQLGSVELALLKVRVVSSSSGHEFRPTNDLFRPHNYLLSSFVGCQSVSRDMLSQHKVHGLLELLL